MGTGNLGWNDSNTGSEFQSDSNQQIDTGGNGVIDEDDEPVKKLSLRSTMLILIGLLVLAIVVIMIVRGIHIVKEPGTDASAPEAAQSATIEAMSDQAENSQSGKPASEPVEKDATIETESASKFTDTEPNSGEISPDFEGSDRSASSKVNSSKSEEIQDIDVPEEVEESSGSSDTSGSRVSDVSKVSMPDLSEPKTASAMVSSKSVLRIDSSSFAYCVNLMILVGEDDYRDVRYFCPKKTYDGVSEGDTLSVEYQTDSDGVVSISTVTK